LKRIPTVIAYPLHRIMTNWEDEKDWNTLIACVILLRESGMLRRLDLILSPGDFREDVVTAIRGLRHNETK